MSKGFASKDIISRLTEKISRFPSLGHRSARRIILHLLGDKERILLPLIDDLINANNMIIPCSICGALTESDRSMNKNDPEKEICEICSSDSRDKSKICVVANIGDMWAIEKSSCYDGLYHILDGVLSAIDGITPAHLRIHELIKRISPKMDLGNCLDDHNVESDRENNSTECHIGAYHENTRKHLAIKADLCSISRNSNNIKTYDANTNNENANDNKGKNIIKDDMVDHMDRKDRTLRGKKVHDIKDVTSKNDIKEIILCFSSTIDGQATHHYLVSEIQDVFVGDMEQFIPKISAPARGIPLGGELEYLDEATIYAAFADRWTV